MSREHNRIVTVALASHRPEIVRGAASLMARHDAILLEEPPSTELDRMLSGCSLFSAVSARKNHGDDTHMQPTRFDAEFDLAPLPFDPRHAALARQLKERGLSWTPHVGCFVWDPDEWIAVRSPFPDRIYFILSLPRFLRGLGSLEAITERLVWLPTWHQARLLCRRLGVADREVAAIWDAEPPPAAGEELLAIYRLLKGALQRRREG